jgi:hypothetical protein
MAVVLWGSKTPGERERDRDRAVSNNKKKVRQKRDTGTAGFQEGLRQDYVVEKEARTWLSLTI